MHVVKQVTAYIFMHLKLLYVKMKMHRLVTYEIWHCVNNGNTWAEGITSSVIIKFYK